MHPLGPARLALGAALVVVVGGVACTKKPKFCGVRATVSAAGDTLPPSQLDEVAAVLKERLPNVERLAVENIEVVEGSLSIRVAKQPDESLDALTRRLTGAVESFRPSELAFHLVIDDADARKAATEGMVRVFGDQIVRPTEGAPEIATVLGVKRGDLTHELARREVKRGQTYVLQSAGTSTWKVLLVEAQGPLRARSIHAAKVAMNEANQPVVTVTFDPKGSRVLDMLTRRAQGHFLAIVIDGEAVSVPKVQTPISSGKIQITLGSGGSKQEKFREAQGLAASLQLASVQSSRPLRLQVGDVVNDCGDTP